MKETGKDSEYMRVCEKVMSHHLWLFIVFMDGVEREIKGSYYLINSQ